jgi:hypothetical protein
MIEYSSGMNSVINLEAKLVNPGETPAVKALIKVTPPDKFPWILNLQPKCPAKRYLRLAKCGTKSLIGEYRTQDVCSGTVKKKQKFCKIWDLAIDKIPKKFYHLFPNTKVEVIRFC